jgi:hypothetical protein
MLKEFFCSFLAIKITNTTCFIYLEIFIDFFCVINICVCLQITEGGVAVDEFGLPRIPA